MSEDNAKVVLPSADEFSREALGLAKSEDIGVIAATTELCDKYGIEHEHVKKFIADPLRVAMHAEASDLNLLKEKVKTRKLF
ncbi:hypothetical protein MYOV003v1_p0202 [Vibrio phage 207E48.1]|nr:hypothetical protein MYOV003v1_p0202 [Vibrio phage 207E48.1]